MTSFSKLQSKVIKSETSLSLLFSTVVVALQTIRSHSAFFYSDDYTLIKNQSQPISEVFNQFNGHFMPIIQIIYRAFIGVFGLQSYAPFLIFSGLCNLFFVFSMTYFLRFNKFSKLTIILVPSLILMVPYTAHTIFWLAVALNLISIGLLLLHTMLSTQRALLVSTILMSIFGIGIGGYGLPLVFGILINNILRRKLWPAAASVFMIIGTLAIYVNFRTAGNLAVDRSVLRWVITNFQTLISTFTPGFIDASVIKLIVELVFYIGLMLLFLTIIQWKPREFSMYEINALTFLVPLITFVSMIAISRNGTESITASRYMLIASSLLTLFCLMASKSFDLRFGISNARLNLQIILVVTLIFSAFFRVFYWWQAPLDINYQSSINRSHVVNAVCDTKPGSKIEIDYAQIDGLVYFPATLDTTAWSTFRKVNC